MSFFNCMHWIYLTRIKNFPMSKIAEILPEQIDKNISPKEAAYLRECHLGRHKELKYIFNKFKNLNFELIEETSRQHNNIPSLTNGLYIIGNITYNINTNKKFFWVKVGLSSDLRKRIMNYYTQNPTITEIDYYIINNKDRQKRKLRTDATEKICHFALNQIAIGRMCKEWFLVSEKDYLEICKKGFSWFGLD